MNIQDAKYFASFKYACTVCSWSQYNALSDWLIEGLSWAYQNKAKSHNYNKQLIHLEYSACYRKTSYLTLC